MASVDEDGAPPLIDKAIDMGIDPRISHILNGLDITASSDLIEQLSTDIDRKELEQCRNILFENAKLRFTSEYQTSHAGKPDPKLEISGRNGDLINHKYARDIIELCKYVFEKVDFFPPNVLSSSCKKTYLELVNSKDVPVFIQESDSSETSVDPKDQMITILLEKNDKLARGIDKLWEYLLNVEKVHGDELLNLRKNINSGGSGLNSIPNTKQSTVSQHSSGSSNNTQSGYNPPQLMRSDDSVDLSSRSTQAQTQQPTAPTSHPESQGAFINGVQQGAASGAEHDGPQSTPAGEGHHAGPQHQEKKKPTAEEISNNENNPIHIDESPVMVRDGGNTHTSDTVEDNAWITPRYNRDSRRRRSHDTSDNEERNGAPQRGGIRPKYELSGMKQVKSVEMYVHGLHLKEGQSPKDLAINVRHYCEDKGVRVMASRVVRNWHDDQLVGCKISVPERNMDTVIADRFWPHFITCRKWEVRKRNNHDDRHEQDYELSSRQPDDRYTVSRYPNDRDYRR